MAASRKSGSFFRLLVLLGFESCMLNYGDHFCMGIDERLLCSNCMGKKVFSFSSFKLVLYCGFFGDYDKK